MSVVTYDVGGIEIGAAEKARKPGHLLMRIVDALEQSQRRRADRVLAKYAPSFVVGAGEGGRAARHHD